jgi:hypothetical protein
LAAGAVALAGLCGQPSWGGSASVAATLYVSPTGSDGNPGTASAPLATLGRARDLVRRMNRNMSGDIVVSLYGGTHRLAEPLRLGPEDSGTNGHDIVYTAVPGEKPVISGGVRVIGWRPSDDRRDVWLAAAPPALQDSRQLYVNGIRAQRARGRVPVTLTKTAAGYTAGSPVMAEWRNPTDVEFVYSGGNSLWSEDQLGVGPWTEARCPIARIEGTEIAMAQPCWDNSTRRPARDGKRATNLVGPSSVGKEPSYVENAFELLGTPGQWYFDRSARRIYYVPRRGEDLATADVEVPVLETLIAGEGADGRSIHNIVFSRLQFAYATWLRPGTPVGFSEIQNNYTLTTEGGYATEGLCELVPGGTCPYGAWTKTPGNVSFFHDKGIRFLDDAFVHLGAAALELGNGSQSDMVRGCVFTDVSGNGIELGDVNLPLASEWDLTRDNQIANNHLYDIGAEYHGAVALLVGYTQRTRIEHNQIDHVPYTAISIGWGGWLDKAQLPGQANNSRSNVVADNLIFDHVLKMGDGGSIYTQGLTGPTLAQGERVTGNVIHDQFGSGHCLYIDNGAANVTVARNVVFRTNQDNWGGVHSSYYDGHHGEVFDPLVVEDNYWQQGAPSRNERGVLIRNNHLISALRQAPRAILDTAGLEPRYRRLLAERFAEPSPPDAPSHVAAFAGDGFAYVAWAPPQFEGGSAVESYLVTSSAGDQATLSAADFEAHGHVRLDGLANAREYTFTVASANAHGMSVPSLPSRVVTPAARPIAPPSAPSNVSAFASDGMATVYFEGPAVSGGSDGGSPITAFTFTATPGGRTVTLAGRIVLTLWGNHRLFGVVDGLRAGQTYTFDVAAVNAAGEGTRATTRPVTLPR